MVALCIYQKEKQEMPGEFAGRVFSLKKGGFNPGSVIHLVSKAAKDDSVLGD